MANHDPTASESSAAGPSLEQDEARLQEYARQLADAFERVAEPWLLGLIGQRAPGVAGEPQVQERVHEAAQNATARVRSLLAADIEDQRVGPLQLLRQAAQGVPTEELSRANVPAPRRDEFAIRNFPGDIYDLSPASFGDVDPSLHEPGLVWGAAKAHVHLRRRREA